jgi:hypothetical protein
MNLLPFAFQTPDWSLVSIEEHKGEMETEPETGEVKKLTKGMTCFVGNNCEAHRSSTQTGCKLFIAD